MLKATRYDAAEGRLYLDPSLLTGARVDVDGKLYIHPVNTGGAFRTEGSPVSASYLKADVYGHKPPAAYTFAARAVPILRSSSAQYGLSGRTQRTIAPGVRSAAFSLAAESHSRTRGRRRIADNAFVFSVDSDASIAYAATSERLISLERGATLALEARTRRHISFNVRADYTLSTELRRAIYLRSDAQLYFGGVSLGRLPRKIEEVVDIGRVLAGVRGDLNARFRLFVSNISGEELGELRVVEGASVTMSNHRDNAWELSLEMLATEKLNPLTDYVKPVMDLFVKDRAGRERWERFPLGLYRFEVSGPSMTHLPHVSRWSLSGQSPEILLLGDTAHTGYTVVAGANILATVRSILLARGIPDSRILLPARDKALTTTMYFDPAKDQDSVYWLRIVNALLAAGGYYGLYTNAEGFFTTQEIKDVDARPPDMSYGEVGDPLIVGEVADDYKDSNFANKVVVMSTDVNTTPPIVAVAENHDPNSPASIENLGRTVIKVISLQNVISQSVADTLAKDELSKASGRYHRVTMATIPDPRVAPRQVYDALLHNQRGHEILGGRWRVININLPLSGERMTHELARSERW